MNPPRLSSVVHPFQKPTTRILIFSFCAVLSIDHQHSCPQYTTPCPYCVIFIAIHFGAIVVSLFLWFHFLWCLYCFTGIVNIKNSIWKSNIHFFTQILLGLSFLCFIFSKPVYKPGCNQFLKSVTHLRRSCLKSTSTSVQM